jgi:hypothetical protein
MKRRGAAPLAVLFGLLLATGSGACGAAPTPAPSWAVSAEDVIRQPGEWPAQPADGAVIALVLGGCMEAIGPAPVVASEDRGFGVAFVLLGDARNAGFCEVRTAGGSLSEAGGGAGGTSYGRGPDLFIVSGGVAPERSHLMGITPNGAAAVRAVVGDHAVDATLGGELFVVSWPIDAPARLLVALDADGSEIARIDAEDLAAYADDCPSFLDPRILDPSLVDPDCTP